MKKKTSKKKNKVSAAMSTLGAIGGSSTVRKYGKRHMKNLAKSYWNSPAGLLRKKK